MTKTLTVALITFVSVSVFAQNKERVTAKKSRGPASIAVTSKHYKDPRSHSGSTSHGLPADLMKAFKAAQK